jgi:hypothetical protein
LGAALLDCSPCFMAIGAELGTGVAAAPAVEPAPRVEVEVG